VSFLSLRKDTTDARDTELMQLRADLFDAQSRVAIADELLGRETERADALAAQLTETEGALAAERAVALPRLADILGDDDLPAGAHGTGELAEVA
jgi:membrane protein involved in colicin uptake